ncbi:YqaA family protein [Derxia gummosa]|uniref:YqaA family protein n=1 Tax=Derxia gummosa DSM 723 TaxID=1121388 RepID=A0A8B6X892_9BURK|nr:VTT domain-containing protein [Derxia gummosa]
MFDSLSSVTDLLPSADDLLHWLLEWLAVPQQGLVALALAAFVAASLVPLASEAVLLAVIAARPHEFWLAIAVATVANTLGSLTTYWLGRVGKRVPHPPQFDRHVAWFEALGAKLLFFAWVPWIGDLLVIVAGWLKVDAWAAAGWIAVGKALRYVGIALGADWLI